LSLGFWNSFSFYQRHKGSDSNILPALPDEIVAGKQLPSIDLAKDAPLWTCQTH
jgi:hypothetical protein